jgi:hypothetical protein
VLPRSSKKKKKDVQKQQKSPTSTKEASLQGKTGAISLGAFVGGTQGFFGYQG